MSKKPDQVVFNEETQKYDAYLKPYATSFTAPKIEVNDIVSWKQQHAHVANSQFSTAFEEIKAQYDEMIEKYQYNQILYDAKYNFEPIVGHTYHLYKRVNEEFFLSILSPEECNFNYVSSFQLNSDKIWNKK